MEISTILKSTDNPVSQSSCAMLYKDTVCSLSDIRKAAWLRGHNSLISDSMIITKNKFIVMFLELHTLWLGWDLFIYFGETWNKIKQFYPRYTFRYVMYKTMSIFTGPRCFRRTHLFQYSFYELRLYVRRHKIYCDWWLSWQRPNALMIVSKVYYIAIQKHLLPSVHHSDVNMNICISTE